MKNPLYLLILISWAASACQATQIPPTLRPLSRPSPTPGNASAEESRLPPDHATSTPTKIALPSATPSPTILPSPVPTASPTLVVRIDLSRFDPDVKPPIMVMHNEPLIAKSDETIILKFHFLCGYALQLPGAQCNYNATVFFSYSEKNDFSPVSLKRDLQEEEQYWTATLPATNAIGAPLRYYLKVNDPKVGLDLRFPVEGTIDLFTVPAFIPIDLPAQKPVETGELALAVSWGSAPKAVGLQKREGYPLRQGPPAMDVAADGRIALLDFVNERVQIYSPKEQSFTSIPLPFHYRAPGDLQFDRSGQLAILDGFGQPLEQPTVNIPRLYRMASEGTIDKVAPVFVTYTYKLTKDMEVQDLSDWRLVTPFGPSGEANSREQQRHRRNPPLPYRFVEDLEFYVARFGDVDAGLAFEMHSISPLGAIIYFEKTPQGYVVIFFGDLIRAVWFDASGFILKDVTLPNNQYSEVEPHGQIAIDQSGSLYVLGSTVRGIEVSFVKAP